MATIITSEDGEMLNLDHISVIERYESDANPGEIRLRAVRAAGRSYTLFKGSPQEVEEFEKRLKELLRRTGTVIDSVEEAHKLSKAKMDEQERIAPRKPEPLGDDFFKDGEL